MNATILSALADSGLFLVGNQLNEESEFLKLMAGEDEDSHVVAFEDDLMKCRCCCCTGECQSDAYDGPSFEEVLTEGFVEGDYSHLDVVLPCACQSTLMGWSSNEDCLPECSRFMGYGIAPRACWFA